MSSENEKEIRIDRKVERIEKNSVDKKTISRPPKSENMPREK
ncbi:MAG TPA: hypothetical protein VK105_20315 [Virgibacillus sp.]|nr:hypothetical protein [Virgibacillus sp.]HLR69438.1 hypothetical protein [Virgibacillus sp.]